LESSDLRQFHLGAVGKGQEVFIADQQVYCPAMGAIIPRALSSDSWNDVENENYRPLERYQNFLSQEAQG